MIWTRMIVRSFGGSFLIWQMDNDQGLLGRNLQSFSNDRLSWVIVVMSIVPDMEWGHLLYCPCFVHCPDGMTGTYTTTTCPPVCQVCVQSSQDSHTVLRHIRVSSNYGLGRLRADWEAGDDAGWLHLWCGWSSCFARQCVTGCAETHKESIVYYFSAMMSKGLNYKY